MALIKCTECGKEISDKAAQCIHCGCPIEKEKVMYCEECGSVIRKNDKACKNCGYPVEKEKVMYCEECGGVIRENDKVCKNCGYPVEREKVMYCEECGNAINENDKVCKNCHNSTDNEKTVKVEKAEKIETKKNTKKTRIIYENLTKQQIAEVIRYRKIIGQYNIGSRVTNLILFIVGMFAFLFGIFTLGLSILIYIICLIVARSVLMPKIILEDKQWFDSNFDKLIENNILDQEELDNDRQKTYDELNYYDLNRIKCYRMLNNEYKINSRKKYTFYIVLTIVSLMLAVLIIFIPVLIFSYIKLMSLMKKVKEEDKQWYEENVERLYREKQLPFK